MFNSYEMELYSVLAMSFDYLAPRPEKECLQWVLIIWRPDRKKNATSCRIRPTVKFISLAGISRYPFCSKTFRPQTYHPWWILKKPFPVIADNEQWSSIYYYKWPVNGIDIFICTKTEILEQLVSKTFIALYCIWKKKLLLFLVNFSLSR